MSRSLTTALNNQLVSNEMAPFFAVDLAFDGGDFLTWTGHGDITFGGKTYVGSGDVLSVQPTQETSEIKANGISVVLSGIPSSLVSSALSESYQGRSATIYFGVLSNYAVVSDPYIIFKGSMDTMIISDSGETANIKINAESKLIDLDRARERRYTSEDLKIDFPDDKGLEYIDDLQDKEIVWGS